jgi:hypothetical protein
LGRKFASKNNSDFRRKRQNDALIFFVYFFASRQKMEMGSGAKPLEKKKQIFNIHLAINKTIVPLL